MEMLILLMIPTDEADNTKLSLVIPEGIYSLPRDLSPSSSAIYLLIGDFIFLHTPIIRGFPAWTISTFSDLAWPTGISELHTNEWELSMWQYIPYEMFTLPVDSIIILDVDSSYDSDILSHVEFVSLHMGNVMGIYVFS